jgi:hypothetical protein
MGVLVRVGAACLLAAAAVCWVPRLRVGRTPPSQPFAPEPSHDPWDGGRAMAAAVGPAPSPDDGSFILEVGPAPHPPPLLSTTLEVGPWRLMVCVVVA